MISIFYGTRPEYIKIYKLYTILKSSGVKCELVKVQQHTTLIDSCEYDRIVKVESLGKNRLNSVITNCLADDVLLPETKIVVVQGDTATSFSIALNAFNSKVKIAHIEAGLRTFDKDNPYPEESYRRSISLFADYHFCVSGMGKEFLRAEGIMKNVYVVGNTVLDNLSKDGIIYGNTIPITLHRRENQDKIESILNKIESVAKKHPNLEFVYIRHPTVKLDFSKYKSLKISDPLPHDKMLSMIKESKFVITDSGGIQEESSFFKKKSIVYRKLTERQEGLNVFSFLCDDNVTLERLIDEFDLKYAMNEPCPYGDGSSSLRIADILSWETRK